MPVTIIWCEGLVSNPTTDVKRKCHLCCPYFILSFKDRVKAKTASIKLSFHFILGVLKVIDPHFVLNNLVSQYFDMGAFLVNPLVFASCFHYLYQDI